MHVFKREIKEKMIRNFESKHPDLLLYLDNPYISELLDGIFDVVAEEICDLKNDSVSIKDLNRRRY
ncbi:hypothetical protein AM231_15510 [Paenibacillus solani]|uniref:Uncharacterized protein n=1 Tax=Paenibacillus solani TaxID=1705565 RepID=A0A0M1P7M6_9BACL|nr:hypothetical protein AM231_15510 [Paenibacillus solani]